MVPGEDLAGDLGVGALTEAGGTAEVGEQHGDGLADGAPALAVDGAGAAGAAGASHPARRRTGRRSGATRRAPRLAARTDGGPSGASAPTTEPGEVPVQGAAEATLHCVPTPGLAVGRERTGARPDHVRAPDSASSCGSRGCGPRAAPRRGRPSGGAASARRRVATAASASARRRARAPQEPARPLDPGVDELGHQRAVGLPAGGGEAGRLEEQREDRIGAGRASTGHARRAGSRWSSAGVVNAAASDSCSCGPIATSTSPTRSSLDGK